MSRMGVRPFKYKTRREGRGGKGGAAMAHILLVEDDAALREGLGELLSREGYAVTAARSAQEARRAQSARVDLVILDISLPDGNGVELLREWRRAGAGQNVLILTARDEEYDVVRGLDAGANDYVTKPFRVQELLSRIRALLRRSAPARVKSGALMLDSERMQVLKDGRAVPLTPTEFRLLGAVMRQSGVTTRRLLLEILWDNEAKFVDDNTLSVHMSRLREKIGPEHIRTVRGVGYEWVE